MKISPLLLAVIGVVPLPAVAVDNVPVVSLWANGAPGTPPGTTEKEVYEPAADPVDRLNSRPDFQILVYPGGPLVRDLKVPPKSPPAFLVCAFDDDVANTLVPQLYLKFREAGVPAELHIYARGGHGFGMRPGPLPEASWNERLEAWMGDLQLLAK